MINDRLFTKDLRGEVRHFLTVNAHYYRQWANKDIHDASNTYTGSNVFNGSHSNFIISIPKTLYDRCIVHIENDKIYAAGNIEKYGQNGGKRRSLKRKSSGKKTHKKRMSSKKW